MGVVSIPIFLHPKLLEFEAEKLVELERRYNALEDEVVKPQLLNGAHRIADTYKTYVRRVTGELHSKVVVTENPIRITSGAEHAIFVEKGTRPHIIKPRFRQALRFMMGGKAVFAKHVHHPGTRAQHAMRLAVNDEMPGIVAGLEQEIVMFLSGITGYM